jgi:hypothetical protein
MGNLFSGPPLPVRAPPPAHRPDIPQPAPRTLSQLSDPAQQPADSDRFKPFVLPRSLNVVLSSARARNVQQGHLGDCWALSVIADLAYRHENRLPGQDYFRALFPNTARPSSFTSNSTRARQPTTSSSWSIRFPDGKVVAVNDRFPATVQGDPLGVALRDGCDWVMVLEKAYAKYLGEWSVLGRGGYPEWALCHMTGRPSQRIPLRAVDAARLS